MTAHGFDNNTEDNLDVLQNAETGRPCNKVRASSYLASDSSSPLDEYAKPLSSLSEQSSWD
jgi:hypothetical protein